STISCAIAACSPSSGSRRGAETIRGTTESAIATNANVLRSAGIQRSYQASGNRQLRDQGIVIGTVAALAAPDGRAPAFGQSIKHVIEAHDAERGPPIRRAHVGEPARQFLVCGILVAEPRVEVAADDHRRAHIECRREAARLTQAGWL